MRIHGLRLIGLVHKLCEATAVPPNGLRHVSVNAADAPAQARKNRRHVRSAVGESRYGRRGRTPRHHPGSGGHDHMVRVLRHWKTVGLIVLALLGVSGGSTVAGEAPPTNAPALKPPPLALGAVSEPTEIDNKWFPLIPGTQFTLDGQSDRGFGLRPHRVLFTVTDVTKVVNGVRTVLVWDRDIHGQDGQLVEEEIAFFAQDDRGNVWSFGEYPVVDAEGQRMWM